MQTLSKNQIKYIRSLSQLKFRKEHQAYIVEGLKNAAEWLQQGADIEYIVAVSSWFDHNTELIKAYDTQQCLIATEEDFEKISGFKTPNQVLLIAKMPQQKELIPEAEKGAWTLMLDKVQDPGNLGTIIRTADWFGIKTIICSPDCVEQFNPKVIQSTMGSLLRVNCVYTDLASYLQARPEVPSYAAMLGGTSLDAAKKYAPGLIIMGNESKGISEAVKELVQHRLSIDRIGPDAESLNVAVATGIFCHTLIQ
ncbi:MAG: RNA methyltransferase [Sphingobacteriales bacterium]|nr:MAG: RNA methyltransferase [Sphingobacteriales bacterium]